MSVRVSAYRFTLDPTPAQLVILTQHAGAARWAYNYALAAKDDAWRRRQVAIDELVTLGFTDPAARKMVSTRVPNYVGVSALWRQGRDTDLDPCRGSPWWRGVSSYVFSSAFQAADKAFQSWFDSMAGPRAGRPVGRPRFKRKGRCADSFSMFHDVKKPTIRVETYRRLLIPRLGSVRIHDTAKRLAKGVRDGRTIVKSVTISRGAHRWYASVLVEEEVLDQAATRRQHAAGVVGVDAGVAALVALSTGELASNRRRGEAARRRIAKASQAYARTQRGSARRAKAAARLGRLHHLVAVQRTADLHQISKRLATDWETVVAEDLNIAGMTRRTSPKPDPDLPGAWVPNGAAAKAGLNRALADSALGELRRQLAYKTSWHGSTLYLVNPAYSSQTCSNCGHVARESRKSQAGFSCVACGHAINADVNAARVIRDRGITLAAETTERLNARRGTQNPRVADANEAGRPPDSHVVATGTGVIRASPHAA